MSNAPNSTPVESTIVLPIVKEIDEAARLITQRNDGTPVLDFDVAFDMFMAANEKTWAHDRSQTVGASEVWACLRQLWYDKRAKEFGIEPNEGSEDSGSWGAMKRGDLIENYHVVPALRLALPKMPDLPAGVELLFAGDDQKTIVLGKNSATPDGLIKGLKPGPLWIKGGKQEIYIEDIDSDCIVLEIKSIDPRATLLEEKARHHHQAQMQLGLIREMTPYKPKFAVALYIDASFLTTTPFVVEFDENAYRTGKQRALDIYAVNDPLMIVPEGRFRGDCSNCKWSSACGTATLGAIPEKKSKATPEAIEATDPLVQDFLAAKKAYADAELRVEEAKERIKEAMMDFKVSSMAGGNWKATWFSVKGRTKLNTAKMEEDGIDLSKYQEEGPAHDQLRVTEHLPDKPKKPRKTKGE